MKTKTKRKIKQSKPDVQISNHGGFFLFSPLTKAAREFITNYVVNEETQMYGESVVVEHRYAWDLAEGMKNDGLIVI